MPLTIDLPPEVLAALRLDLPDWAMVKAEVPDRFGEAPELAKTG